MLIYSNREATTPVKTISRLGVRFSLAGGWVRGSFIELVDESSLPKKRTNFEVGVDVVFPLKFKNLKNM